MNKTYKTMTVLVFLYSALLFLAGIFVFIYSFYWGSYIKSMFAVMVDINIWMVNWHFFCYLLISSGLIGISLGREIWKNTIGADRLWLLFITWQVAINLGHIGPYQIGAPDVLSTASVGCLCLFSWVTCRNRKIGSFSLISKNRILEFSVFFVVFTQLSGIIFINSLEDHQLSCNLTRKELDQLLDDSLEKSVREEMLHKTYGKHYKKYMEFYHHYEQKNGRKVKEIGMYLLRNGYSKDKVILIGLGSERYSAGDLSKAINYFCRALEAEYYYEMDKPSSEAMAHFENAQIHYTLSILYAEQGDSEKAKEEYVNSQILFKKVKKEPPSQDLMKKWENMTEMALNHFNKDFQPEPSPQANSANEKNRGANRRH